MADEIRCTCNGHRILAVFHETGVPMVEVKSYRRGRVLSRSVLIDGELKVQCPTCSVWTILVLDDGNLRVSRE